MYGTNINALHIDVYNGVTWNLDIIPTISGNKGNQWNTQNIDLSAFTGIINIRFRGLTGTGSLGDMALDDISVYSKSTVKAEFNTIDPLCANTKIRFNNTSLNSNQHVWTFGPDATPASSIAQDYVDVTFQAAGEKTIKLLAINPSFIDSMTIKIQVEDIPKPNFTYTNIGNDYSFTNTSLYGASYDWNFGDGNSANLSSPKNKFLVNGNYTVTLIAKGNCGEDSIKKNLIIALNQINDFNSNGFISIIPNPANDYLKVNTSTTLKGKWMYKIFTTDGKLQLVNDFNQQEKINIQSLPKGVYLLYLNQGNQDYYQKFIKE